MMGSNSYIDYLKYLHPKAVFSEVKYLLADATGVAGENYSTEGAVATFIQYLYYTTTGAGPAIITFTDQFNAPLFTVNNATIYSNYVPLFITRDGDQVLVKSSIPCQFSIAYQYLTIPKP
jgi:hypothetical protein